MVKYIEYYYLSYKCIALSEGRHRLHTTVRVENGVRHCIYIFYISYIILYYVVCTRKPRDQTPPVVAAGAPSAAVGGHRGHRRRRRKRLLLLFKKAAGQQNAAAASAAGPQINSRPVITRAPFSPRRAGATL